MNRVSHPKILIILKVNIKMVSILSDDILSQLLCSICKQYLSCAPTKIHRNGKISCGRCNTNQSSNPNSLYEKVARSCLFPCVNRYEGCNKLMQYEDVAQHEKTCNGITMSCPVCCPIKSQKMSLLYLINHFKTEHGRYFLKEPKFFIDVNRISVTYYMYRDNLNNCLFIIKVVCTQDRVSLNVSVSGRNKVVQKFRLDNVFVEPNRTVLCTSLDELERQPFEVNIKKETAKQNRRLLCEFVYNILEKNTFVVVNNNNYIEESRIIKSPQERMPTLYLASEIFSADRKYKFSLCKTKLIREHDEHFALNLTCKYCEQYFWNDPGWRLALTTKVPDFNIQHLQEYCLYGFKGENNNRLICMSCAGSFRNLDPVTHTPILNLTLYCRYNCGCLCSIWELHSHEKQCQLNTEKDTVEFVKKCFGQDSYSADDTFVKRNAIQSCILYAKDKKQVIYFINDRGLKFKVYYKRVNGDFFVRVEHDYDKTQYLVSIRTLANRSRGSFYYPPEEIKNLKQHSGQYQSLGKCQLSDRNPWFAVIIKKILPNNIVTDK